MLIPRTSTAGERRFLYSLLIFLLALMGGFFLFIGLTAPAAIIEPTQQAGTAPEPYPFLGIETDDAATRYTIHGCVLLGGAALLWILRLIYLRLVD